MRPCRIELSSRALRHNFSLLKRRASGSRIWAVIKANAYGHGLLFAAKALEKQADGFAVACMEEAQQLRSAGIELPILLLEGLFEAQEVKQAHALNVALVVHRMEQVRWLAEQIPEFSWPLWIKLDTGMHRLGFDWREAKQLSNQIQTLLPRAEVHVMSHLACADEDPDDVTIAQIQRFESATAGWMGMRSLANTAGLMRYPAAHFDWVRPGIGLYGASQWLPDALPVMRFVSEVIAVREIAPGEGLGYGLTDRADHARRIAVVAAGYGDGYPRHAPAGTPVWLAGGVASLAGRVSMDMLCVDITSHPACDRIGPGEYVELWGEHVPVTEVAQRAGTISYELLCGITERVKREQAD